MAYRVGLPLWRLLGRLGVPLALRVYIHRDEQSASYWTSSPDLGGLIVTGRTLDELFKEVALAAPDLLELELGRTVQQPRTTFVPYGGALSPA